MFIVEIFSSVFFFCISVFIEKMPAKRCFFFRLGTTVGQNKKNVCKMKDLTIFRVVINILKKCIERSNSCKRSLECLARYIGAVLARSNCLICCENSTNDYITSVQISIDRTIKFDHFWQLAQAGGLSYQIL